MVLAGERIVMMRLLPFRLSVAWFPLTETVAFVCMRLRQSALGETKRSQLTTPRSRLPLNTGLSVDVVLDENLATTVEHTDSTLDRAVKKHNRVRSVEDAA